MNRLKGKVALITGGAGGIGQATADLFCEEGASVAIVDRDITAVEAFTDVLARRHGAGCAMGIAADVANERDAERAVSDVLDRFGALTTLINNAAIREYFSIGDASQDSWRGILNVNLLGAANFARAALPALRKAGNSSIVNVSSSYAVVGRKGMGQYDATKAALLSLTRTLAWEEAAHAIRINAVCPGGTLTAYHIKREQAAGRPLEEVRAEKRDNSLIARWAEPREIAYPILWLASDEASFITGTTLMVDGGTSIM